MKILVTGSQGYIGSVLTDELVKAGFRVTGLDAGFYETESLYPQEKEIGFIKKDTRSITAADLASFDSVIHLADLSNDPLGVLNPDNTYSINFHGGVRLAKAAKTARVKRFIYSSSCSVYGIATTGLVDEKSPTNPQTPYARCKVFMEEELAKLADSRFCPVILRQATVYGPSPRMRFDLVLNNLCGYAYTTKEIRLTSDGTPWRPIIHVRDICQAVKSVLTAPKDAIYAEIFNVGAKNANYRIREIGQIVSESFPGCKLSVGELAGDTRSYKVSFDKIHAKIPGFKTEHDAKSGTQELKELFEKINLTKDQFESRNFTRVKQLEYLLSEKLIDDKLYWNK